MEPELIERVRRVYESDAMDSGVTKMLELAAPDVEMVPARDWPGLERQVHHGHDGVRRFFEALAEGFDTIRFELDDLTDYGNTLVAEVRFRIAGRSSGITGEQPLAHVLKFRDGLVVRLEAHLDPQDAHASARALSSAGP